jgi:hypothetical protein
MGLEQRSDIYRRAQSGAQQEEPPKLAVQEGGIGRRGTPEAVIEAERQGLIAQAHGEIRLPEVIGPRMAGRLEAGEEEPD